jgi:hypothetical protein
MDAAAQAPYVEPRAGLLDPAICWMVENLGRHGRRYSSKYSRRLGAVISSSRLGCGQKVEGGCPGQQ